MQKDYYRVIGQCGSPYSMKMRAMMRYRRIPHVFVNNNMKVREEIAHVRPAVIPVLQYPDGSYHNDSTPLIYDLEKRHPECRSIIPDDPGLAFLAHLIEDMADEWVTKMMFIYRWWRPLDQEYCSRWLAWQFLETAPEEAVTQTANWLRDRQVGRMPLVGNTETTKPVIEESYLKVLDILERNLEHARYLFGSRPSIADFGLFGQLHQLSIDPTPQQVMRQKAPGLTAWLSMLDDASGAETGEWINASDPLPRAVMELLQICGDVYFPFLLANAAAIEKGEQKFSLTLMGKHFTQDVFKYQAKCLAWLREHYAGLTGEPKERIDAVLKETGCYHPLHSNPGQ